MIPLPRIALVGRPNVGKSTLFNRICGRRQAITDGRPGSTRDRNYAQLSWQARAFELVDTGGLLFGSDDPLLGPAARQAEIAITEADIVMLLVDARAGLLPDDAAIARKLRRDGKRVLVVVNKVEGPGQDLADFTELGFDALHAVSAEHGQGIGDLLDAALEGVPVTEAPQETTPPVSVALVGRPNVGKSSILNRLVGRDRAVVSAIPGTTRDSVDEVFEKRGRRYRLVDTAGLRKVRLLKENVDHVSVVQARRALGRAEVAVLVLDAESGLREMDATIGGEVVDAGVGLVIAVNKWDLAAERRLEERKFELSVRDELKFVPWAPVVFVSAKTARGVSTLLAAVDRAHASRRARVTTGEFNRLLMQAADTHVPRPAKGSKPVKILFGSQIGIAPPTFALSVNQPVELHFSYLRYLENRIRDAFGFEGTPIRLKVRYRRHPRRS
ncbi:MAG: ribosome biogenesis GTPase Der [Vicinamibacterales bacterium]|jgi:GTP-binding protein